MEYKKITGIYVITNRINKKQYVGLSTNCVRRWYDHRSKSINSHKKDDIEKPLYRAMRKYGLDNFSFSILEECPKELLCEREVFWIEKLKSYSDGYNATIGGDMIPDQARLKGSKHGMAKLTEDDVIYCRECYRKGLRAKEIWEKEYSGIIKWTGFERMWHGKTWKHIIPEVFESNPHPAKHVTPELIEQVLEVFNITKNYNGTARAFKGILGYGTIYNICKTNGKRTYSKRKK